MGEFDRLGVNVASIIIGALVLLVVLAWIEVTDALSNQVFFDDQNEGRRYVHELKKKFLSALAVTILSVFLAIVVYVYYSRDSKLNIVRPTDKPYESVYNIASVHSSNL